NFPFKQAVLDGEVVVLKEDGTSNFQALQNAMHEGAQGSLIYYVFDLLHLNGKDTRSLPLIQRKEILREVFKGQDPKGAIRYTDHIEGEGEAFFKQACRSALEGVISKMRDK